MGTCPGSLRPAPAPSQGTHLPPQAPIPEEQGEEVLSRAGAGTGVTSSVAGAALLGFLLLAHLEVEGVAVRWGAVRKAAVLGQKGESGRGPEGSELQTAWGGLLGGSQ